MNLVKELWRGEVTLFKAYWVYGFAVSVLLNGLMLMLLGLTQMTPNSPFFMVLWIATTAYGVFIAVAIWRSAGNYKGPKVWMALARTMVVLSILRTILNLTGAV